jgi:hypothetical protein
LKDRKISEYLAGKHVEDSGHSLKNFPGETGENHENTILTGVPAEVQIQLFPNASPEILVLKFVWYCTFYKGTTP